MIAPLLLTALLAQADPDPCAPVPALRPDPQGAAAYQAVGDEERAAGRTTSAVAAYRAALARDPARAGPRQALAELCARERSTEGLTRGLALFRAGRCADAIPPLDAARLEGDRSAALLEGICLYRTGQDERSAEALHQAELEEDTRATARLFLGLLALRRGRPAEAAPLIESAAADPLLAPVAQGLSRDLQRRGAVVLSLLSEGGWDSNADLTPGGSLSPGGAGDGFYGGAAAVSVSPWGDGGAYARAAVSWRNQLHKSDLDLLGMGAALGFQLGTARRHVLVEAGWDDRRLGGRPYLRAPRLQAEGRLGLGERWSVGGWYALRRESYLSGQGDYSGWRHAGQADVSAQLGRAVLTLAWQGGLDQARVRRSYREHGPVLALAAALGGRTRLILGAGYTWRDYTADDPFLEVRRADRFVDAAGRLEVDLGDRWTVLASVAGRRAYSNVPDFRYARLVSTLGLSWTLGIR